MSHLLISGPEPVQQAAWEASRYFALDSSVRKAAAQAADAALPTPKRVVAIRALRGASFPSAAPGAPIHQTAIRTHSREAGRRGHRFPRRLRRSCRAGHDPGTARRSYSPEGRKRAVTALLSQNKRVPLLLKAYPRRSRRGLGPRPRRAFPPVRLPGCGDLQEGARAARKHYKRPR